MSWDSPSTLSPYAGEAMQQAKMASVPTLRQRLEAAVHRAEQDLKLAVEAKEIFDRNPDMERLLNLMQQGRF